LPRPCTKVERVRCWMAASLFVYFAYGLRHSRLNATPNE
jgi:hypothetical protein